MMTIIIENLAIKVINSATVFSLIGFSFWILFKPWFKLSQTYKTSLPLEDINILFEYQSCVLEKTRIKSRLNIGVTNKELYLSLTSPISYVISTFTNQLECNYQN